MTTLHYAPARPTGYAIVRWRDQTGTPYSLHTHPRAVPDAVPSIDRYRPAGIDTPEWCRAVSDAVHAGARGETGTMQVEVTR